MNAFELQMKAMIVGVYTAGMLFVLSVALMSM